MPKKVSLNEVVTNASKILVGSTRENTRLLIDTNGWKLSYHNLNEPIKVSVTTSVYREMERFPEIFSPESITQLKKLLNPLEVNPFLPPEEEYIISLAASQNPKTFPKGNNYLEKENQRQKGDIGWVDTQQIYYGIQRAKKGKNTILWGSDEDLWRTVEALREQYNFIRDHVTTASPRDYAIWENREFLKGIKNPFRLPLIREMESHYLAA